MKARIRGGFGNQLFCYTAARRLALKNDVSLMLDDTTMARTTNMKGGAEHQAECEGWLTRSRLWQRGIVVGILPNDCTLRVAVYGDGGSDYSCYGSCTPNAGRASR